MSYLHYRFPDPTWVEAYPTQQSRAAASRKATKPLAGVRDETISCRIIVPVALPFLADRGLLVARLGFRIEAYEHVLRWIRFRAAAVDASVCSYFPRRLLGPSRFGGHIYLDNRDGQISRQPVSDDADAAASVFPAFMLGFRADDATVVWDLRPVADEARLEIGDLLMSMKAQPGRPIQVRVGLNVSTEHADRGEELVELPERMFSIEQPD
jgi:hypothetical protein